MGALSGVRSTPVDEREQPRDRVLAEARDRARHVGRVDREDARHAERSVLGTHRDRGDREQSIKVPARGSAVEIGNGAAERREPRRNKASSAIVAPSTRRKRRRIASSIKTPLTKQAGEEHADREGVKSAVGPDPGRAVDADQDRVAAEIGRVDVAEFQITEGVDEARTEGQANAATTAAAERMRLFRFGTASMGSGVRAGPPVAPSERSSRGIGFRASAEASRNLAIAADISPARARERRVHP